MPYREKDILSEAIGTKEPTRRTRGLGNLAPWGKAFSGDKEEIRRQRKRAKAELMKLEIMNSLKADFKAKMMAMEERLSSQTIKEMVPLASTGARRSSCASAPYEPSPIDILHGPAQCKLQIKFSMMNFSMDAAFGQVWPSSQVTSSSQCRFDVCTLFVDTSFEITL